MIYTTYFAKINKLPLIVKPVSICLYPPDWYHGAEYKTLAPTPEIFHTYKETGDFEFFKLHYFYHVLDKLNANAVEQELYFLTGFDNVALVCFEKSDQFCHRHFVSSWLNFHGIPCHELKL